MSEWYEEELAEVDLGDKRLSRRAVQVLGSLGKQPSRSIPASCRSWSETLAAYRLFSNEQVTAERLLAPHFAATQERMREHPVVLLVQDSSELDYTGKGSIQGVGPLNWVERQGLFTHLSLAVTPERLSLGLVEAHFWSQEPGVPHKNASRKRTKIGDKQSGWWLRSYQKACQIAGQMPSTKVVSVADREGDIYEVFVAWQEAPEEARASWVIRACQDRRLTKKLPGPAWHYQKLWAQVAAGEVLGRISFPVPRRGKRAAREVTQTLQACQVELKPPARRGEKLPIVRVWAVLAREEYPSAGEEPLEWLLLTSEAVESLEAAEQVVAWYLARWQVEVFFRVLKSGCRIEQLSLRHVTRLECVIALYLIVAWRVMWVTTLGRVGPGVPADVVFAEEEWKSVYVVVTGEHPPPEPPPLGEFVRMLASLGGYLGRKCDGLPGAQTIWTGMQSMTHYAIGWLSFGPGKATCV
jgi:hypothetical protein